jgi:hypothetical protein
LVHPRKKGQPKNDSGENILEVAALVIAQMLQSGLMVGKLGANWQIRKN